MTLLRRVVCFIFGHTDVRIFAIDRKSGTTRYVCRSCLTAWTEYDG